MRAHRFVSLLLALLAFACITMPTPSCARGPEVPCTGVDCTQIPLFDMPASGFWGNPEEMGIAIHLFIQNEVSFGTYYGYTETGAPIWYLFVLRFERPGDAPGLLRARTTLEQYANGSCIGCPYSAPEQVDLPGTIELTFDQRNHGTYRINGGEAIHIVPLEANSPVALEFADEMHYALPDPEGAWVLTFKAEASERYPYERLGSVSGVFGAKVAAGDGNSTGLGWPFAVGSPAGPESDFSLYCEATSGSPPFRMPPECALRVNASWGMFPEFATGIVRFPLPYANITGGRIVSKDPFTGIRLEAFRIGYD
jgi:hypothetical protein